MFKDVPSQFDFPAEEKRILKFWDERGIHEKSQKAREGGKPFVFFEGPPTANGLPHPGHCLTRAMKDLFPRYKTMTGHHCLRKGGWDTHGLPVEVEVCKELGIHSKEEIEHYGVEPFNRKCLESVFRYTKEWEELTRRLGFWVNLDEAYVTYHQSYVESVWWSLKQLFDAGKLYQGHKIVWWWAQGGTALSSGEVGQGYREVDDPSVFVRFPLTGESKDSLCSKLGLKDRESKDSLCAQSETKTQTGKENLCPTDSASNSPGISLLVWTTTPWTLPSNMFAAVHPEIEYAVVHDEKSGERLILASALVEPIRKKAKGEHWKVEATLKGRDLIGLCYVPPFRECFYDKDEWHPDLESNMGLSTLRGPNQAKDGRWATFGEITGKLKGGGREPLMWRITAADFVTIDSGSGAVHEAPAFGEVDFDLLQKEKARFESESAFPDEPVIPFLNAVRPNGTFTDDAPVYCRGRWVKDCDKDICRDLKEREAYPGSKIPILLHQEQYRHDYPFCWRAEQDPLIQYPRKSWFIKTTDFKDEMLANNQGIHWLPDHIKDGRFGKFLESNVDWSLSRERYWGTPLPIWVCDACGHMEAIDSYDALLAKKGVTGQELWAHAKDKEPGLSEHLKVHKPYIDAIQYDCPKCAADPSASRKPQAASSHAASLKTQDSGLKAPRMHRVPEVIDCWYDSGAMPFAQWGWPHQNRDRLNPASLMNQYPADFISEALDQTRGWFYSLTAIATMLFGKKGVANRQVSGVGGQGSGSAQAASPKPQDSGLKSQDSGLLPSAAYPQPFRNCIVLGLLLGEDGLKMSKSKKNYREPSYIFDKEGADAMRWLFFSGQAPWTSIRFQESAIAEGQREFLIRLYNVYSFFVIYANIDKWSPATGAPTSADTSRERQRAGMAGVASNELSELDRWMLSELNRTIRDVRAALDAYDNFSAAKSLIAFVDGLSNWYVRRSRDRFWKPGMDADKRAAYAVLYHCLCVTTRLIAPFTPFFAESLYQNLEGTGAAPSPESVHLCDYPTADPARIDDKLSDEMAVVREIVSLGRAARAEAKMKVRQPLALVEIVLADKSHSAWLASHEALIADELNVKKVEFTAEADHYVNYSVKPNFKSIGPKFGKLGNAIKAALAAAKDPAAMRRQLDTAGKTTLVVEGQTVELTPDDVQIELTAKPGWAAAQGRSAVVVLKTDVSDDLRAEGMARELVHHVQQKRKDLDLKYEQRIDLAIVAGPEVQAVVKQFAEYIMGETLAQSLLSAPLTGVEPVATDIEGHEAAVYVKAV